MYHIMSVYRDTLSHVHYTYIQIYKYQYIYVYIQRETHTYLYIYKYISLHMHTYISCVKYISHMYQFKLHILYIHDVWPNSICGNRAESSWYNAGVCYKGQPNEGHHRPVKCNNVKWRTEGLALNHTTGQSSLRMGWESASRTPNSSCERSVVLVSQRAPHEFAHFDEFAHFTALMRQLIHNVNLFFKSPSPLHYPGHTCVNFPWMHAVRSCKSSFANTWSH